MSVNYTILKSSIIYSTIWEEDAETCKVWVTMLAMRNKDGEIFSSLPGLSHVSRIGLEKTIESVQKFISPDKNSTTKEHEGRRIEEISGGWRLLNHEKVKAEASSANKAAYMATYMKKKRAKEKSTGLDGKPASAAYKAGESAAVNGFENGKLDKDFQPI